MVNLHVAQICAKRSFVEDRQMFAKIVKMFANSPNMRKATSACRSEFHFVENRQMFAKIVKMFANSPNMRK